MAMSSKQTSLVNDYRTMFEEEHDRQPNLDNETILGLINSVPGDSDDADEEIISKMLDEEPADDNGNGAHDRTPETAKELTGDELAKMSETEKKQAQSAAALAAKFDDKANAVAREVVAAGKKWKGGPVLVRKELLRLYGKKTTIVVPGSEDVDGTSFVDLPDFPNVDSEKGSNRFPPGPYGLFDRYPGRRTNADGEEKQVKLSWYTVFVERTEYGKELLVSTEWKIGKEVAYKSDSKVPENIRKLPVPDVRERKADDKADYAAFKNSVKKAMRFHTKVREIVAHLGDKVTVYVSDDIKSTPVRVLQKSNGVLEMYTLQQVQQLDALAASKMGGENVIANLNETLNRDRKTPPAKASQGFDKDMSAETALNGLGTLALWGDKKTELGAKHLKSLSLKLAGEGNEANILAVGAVVTMLDGIWTDEMHKAYSKIVASLDADDGVARATKIAALLAKEAEKPAAKVA